MSGHSKWSKVKHQKATTDVVKAQAFTKASRALTIAVQEGSGITNPDLNFRLRLAIEKARDVNMPKDTILRAIEKGTSTESSALMHRVYECFCTQGVAMLIDVTTDNTNRIVSELKNILERGGGRLTAPGSVQHLFRQVGIIVIAKTITYDALLLDAVNAGADDVIERDDMFEVYVKPHDLHAVYQKLAGMGLRIDNHALIMHPVSLVHVPDDDNQKSIETLVSQIKQIDGVDEVYTNTEI